MTTKSAPSTGYISNPLGLFRPSLEAVKVNLGTLLAALLCLVGAVALVVMATVAKFVGSGWKGDYTVELSAAQLPEVLTWTVLVLAVVGLAVAIFAPAITLIALRSAKAEKISIGEAFSQGWHYVGRFLLIGVLTALAFMGGLLLMVIPGFVFAIWFSLAFYAAIDEDLPAIAAMKRSKQLVKGHFWEMAGLLSVGTAFGVLRIVPVLGWLASTILSIIYTPSTAIRYLQLKQHGDEPVRTHVMNYVLIVIALLVGGQEAARSNTAQDTGLLTPATESSSVK